MSIRHRFESVTKRSHGLPTVAWLLVPLLGVFFLVYPVTILLASDPARWKISLALGGAALFSGVFLWFMWTREPLQLTSAEPSEVMRYRAILLFLALLAGTLSYFLGAEWRMLFFYHINVAAGIMLPRRDACAAVATIAGLTLIFGFSTGLAWLAVPAVALGLWAMSFVRQVATVAELEVAREELARLAVSEERLRFARDLHDLLGHSLTLITLKSELAGRLIPDTPENERGLEEVRDLQGVARGALREVREAVSGYRRPSLDEELAGGRAMLAAAGISCEVHDEVGVLPNEVGKTLTCAVREGVTNVVRHSRAKHCEIRLSSDGSRCLLTVVDDGRGLAPERREERVGGSGLRGLRERVIASGGSLEAGKIPAAGGFRLTLSLPLGEGALPGERLESGLPASGVGSAGGDQR